MGKSMTGWRSAAAMVWLIGVVFLAAPSALALEVQEAELNRWIQVKTPEKAVDYPSMPPLFRQFIRSDQPHVMLFRYPLTRGNAFTIQVEYPADRRQGAVNLLGTDPLAVSKPPALPQGAVLRLVVRNRTFPGGNIEGYTYGHKSNFRVASDSTGDKAWVAVSSQLPGTPFRFRILSPAEPDDQILKSGTYRIPPQGGIQTSYSTVAAQSLWLDGAGPLTAGRGQQPPLPSQDLGPWIIRIKSGQSFWIIFDQTAAKFDDSRYSGDWRTDPMGTLKGGETYGVTYGAGQFLTTGFNQQQGKVMSASSPGHDLDQGKISLWGRVYVFDSQGRILDPVYGLVGHLSKEDPGGPGKQTGAAPFSCPELAGRFMDLIRTKDFNTAMSMCSDGFQQEVSRADLEDFGKALSAFGNSRTVQLSCLETEALVIMENQKGRLLSIHMQMKDNRIDRCFARQGVQ